MFLSGLFVILLTVGRALLHILDESPLSYICIPSTYFSCGFVFPWTVVSLASSDELDLGPGSFFFCWFRDWDRIEAAQNVVLGDEGCPQQLSFLILISGSSHERPLRNFLSTSKHFWGCCCVCNFLVSRQEGQRKESFHSWSNWLHILLLTSQFCWHAASILHTVSKMFYWAPTWFLGFPVA